MTARPGPAPSCRLRPALLASQKNATKNVATVWPCDAGAGEDMRRTARIATWALTLLIFLVLFVPVRLPEARAAQPAKPPAPVPIRDTTPHGKPERVELDGGRFKLVYKNSQGQIIREEEFDGVGMTTTHVASVYPGGQAAEVTIVRIDDPFSGPRMDVVRYDSSGVAQEREIRGNDGDIHREKWNPKSKQWEAAPERQRWNPYTGKWETVPDDWRFDSKQGGWQRLNPKTGQWEPVPQRDEGDSILDEIEPPKIGPIVSAAKRGHAVAAEALAGLTTTIFSTPRGRLRVNLPNDMAAGDKISGTIFAEADGRDQREQTRNLGELRGYVIEVEKQKTAASSSSPATGTPFTLAIPASGATTNLILRDKDGDEVARRTLPIMRQLPVPATIDIPKLGQQGSPLAIGGPFDGDFKNTTVKVGGEDLQKLAESPRQIVAHNTTSHVGVSKCEVTEGSQTATGEIRTLGIALSAPKLDLLKGEQTTLTVTVSGLEGIEGPVPLELENKSSGVIQMSGGELQRTSISPSQVQGGMYTIERTLTGIQRGAFTILGTVSIVNDPRKSQTRADLTIAKSASPVLGSKLINYVITIFNSGPNGADTVVVTDNLPPGLTIKSCEATALQKDERGAGGKGLCPNSGNPRRITFPYLAPGATANIVIVASPDGSAAGQLTNTAEVSSLTPDPNLSDNRDDATTEIPSPTYTSTPRPGLKPPPPPDDPPPPTAADLQITKTAVPTVVKAGDRITYTIVVTNGGPNTAVAPLILDSVPIDTTYVACKVTRGACKFGVAAGGLVDAVLPDMPKGAMETLTVDVDVKKTVGPGTAIINDAEVSSTTPDPNGVNNKATAIVWVRAPVPLVVISEFRTRGPRGEKDEFIELDNRSNQRLDLSGWTLMVSNASGATTTLLTIAPGTLVPGRSHLLLTNAEGYSGSVPGDQTFGGDIPDDGGIALMPLRGIPGDEVGMSNGSRFKEGTVLSPILKNADQSYERSRSGDAGGIMLDSNNNHADFRLRAPSDPQRLAGRSPGVR